MEAEGNAWAEQREQEYRQHPGAEQRELLREPKQYGKQQRIDADPGLDARVERQQPRTRALLVRAFEHAPRRPAEQRVPARKAAEEDREDRRGRLAVRAEQRREVLLPGHLVDETRKPGQHREQQRDQANHRSESTPIRSAERPANIARRRSRVCERERSLRATRSAAKTRVSICRAGDRIERPAARRSKRHFRFSENPKDTR